MSDEEDTTGELADQLGDLELELSEDAASEDDSRASPSEEESGGSESEDASSLSPEEQFERALEEMDDESLRGATSSGADAAESGTVSEEGGDADRDEGRRYRESVEASAFSEELEEVDRANLPDEPERSDTTAPTPNESNEGSGASTSPREQFEESIQEWSRSEMRRRKYGLERDPERTEADESGEGSTASEETSAEESTEADGGTQGRITRAEEATFREAVRDADRLETNAAKHRHPSAPDPSSYFDGSEARTADDFSTPRLPKSGEGLNEIPPLDDAQEAMLERRESWGRDHDVPELHLRGERVEDAIERLRGFIQQATSRKTRFVRIVHGRGKNSEGPPVLKPAVLEWLETSAADWIEGYVPERNLSGDYGSIVVEFLVGDEA